MSHSWTKKICMINIMCKVCADSVVELSLNILNARECYLTSDKRQALSSSASQASCPEVMEVFHAQVS